MSYQLIPVSFGMVSAYLLKSSEGKSILIDCGIPGSEGTILGTMADNGIAKEDLVLIIITHGHADHMGSAYAMREATGAKTLIHILDADIIRTGRAPRLIPTNLKGKLLANFSADKIIGVPNYEPEILLQSEMSLEDYGFDGRVIETPGHTGGSVSVVMGDGNVFIGDLIMGGMIGKGKPQRPMFADNMIKVSESIRKIIALSPKMIYVGHGGPFTPEEMKSCL